MGVHAEPLLDVFRRYVHEGLWQNRNEPAYRSLTLTIRDSYALVILAAFTLLLTFAQRQSWSLIRQLLAHWTRSVRLRDDACSNPLQHLSQLEAIMETASLALLSIKNIQSRSRNALLLENAVISPYFGVLSLLNILIFVLAGVAVPWLLSDGWIDLPIVKSEFTKDCFDSNALYFTHSTIKELPKVDAIFRQCLDQPGRDCEERFHIKSPRIERARIDICPFEKEICIKGLKPLEITHRDFTAFEAGVNLKSEITQNRRLTCTPINLEPMIVKAKDSKVHLSIQDLGYGIVPLHTNYTMELKTLNGPNRYSNKISGIEMKRLSIGNDVTVLPEYFTGMEMMYHQSVQDNLTASLRKQDGLPFVLIWRGGNIRYSNPIDDPFFSAHQNFTEHIDPVYYSDHEATGLGCIEKVQYCFPETGQCSNWGHQSQSDKFVIEETIKKFNSRPAVSKNDYIELFLQRSVSRWMYEHFSPYNFLSFQAKFSKVDSPLLIMIGGVTIIEHLDEEWTYQVEKWFHKSYLHGILWFQNGARSDLRTLNPRQLPRRKSYSSCGRILYRDGEYTNINFLGFCLISMLLCLLCISNRLVMLANSNSAMMKMLSVRFLNLLRQLQSYCGRILKLFVEKVQTTILRIPATGMGGGGGGRTAYIPKFLPRITSALNERINTWPRSTHPSPNTPSGAYGLDNLGSHASPSNQGDLSRFEEIDNVI